MTRPDRPADIVIEWLRVKAERPPTERDPRWWFRGYYYIDRATRHVPIGRATRDEAIRLAAAVVSKGRPKDAPPPTTTAHVHTVRDLCETWLGHQDARREAAQIAPRSYLAYRASITRLVSSRRTPTLGAIVAAELTDGQIEDYAVERARSGAPKTINDDVSVLLMAWKWGRKRGYAPARDLSPTALKPRPVRPTRTPDRDELQRLIPHLPARYALLVLLMCATGARVGEIAYLEWADCDREAGVLTLGRHAEACKTGARDVPIEPEIVAALLTWRDRPPEQMKAPPSVLIRERWVCGVVPVSAISSLVSRRLPAACVASGVPRITSHAIRRMVVDEMGAEGIEPATAASVTGHSPAEMYRRYRRPSAGDRRRAVARTRLGVMGRKV